eukprot:1464675-Alexandrium_andersonii.AAC.1
MSASLVGSEMCIRDRAGFMVWTPLFRGSDDCCKHACDAVVCACSAPPSPCLLYTSDAADDM